MKQQQRSYRPLVVEIPKEAHEIYGGRTYYLSLHREGKPKVMRKNSISGVMTSVTSPAELLVVKDWARKTVDAKKEILAAKKAVEAQAEQHATRWTYRIGRFVRTTMDRIGAWFTKELEVFDPHTGDDA